jgi:hypothetical protein
MRGGLSGSVDKSDQRRISPQMNDIAENGKICIVVAVYRSNQTNGFEAAY